MEEGRQSFLCSRCGAVTEPAVLGPDGRGEGACPECGLGFSSSAVTFARTEEGPLQEWWARRRTRRKIATHQARREEVLRRRSFAVHGLDTRWTGLRWMGGWGSSNDEIDHIDLAHGDPYDEAAPLVRVVTWPLSPPMDHIVVANAAQGLAQHLWLDADAPHDLVRSAFTADDPTETWSELTLSVDGQAATFRSLAELLGRGRGASVDHPPSGTLHRGTVAFWHSEEGWGAVRTPDRPGTGFAHFSHIRGTEGYRELQTGQPVEFEWADDFQQDGCQYRVAWVRGTD